MKKLCTVLLAVLMLVSVVLGVVACDNKAETYTAEQIAAAIKLMDMRYGESAQPVKTEDNFTVTNKIRSGAIIFNIKWEVENGGTVVTLGEPDADGIITVKVGETKTEVNYTLKATLVGANGEPVQDENGNTYSKSYPHTVPVSTQKKAILEQYNESVIASPAAETPYKWALFYQPDGKVYYFTGKNDGGDYKWQTSTKVSEAADVYVEVVEGGYHVYFMNGIARKYIEPCTQPGGGASIRTVDAPTYVIKMNEDHVLYADVTDDLSVYMGGYNTYNTIRGSSMEYLTTAPTKQFPARLVSAVDYKYEEFVKPTTEAEIIKAAKNLSDGEILGGSDVTFTLTGRVKSVGDYSEQYGNFDFVIVVADTEFTVFRFKASSNTVVAVDQTVTVTGNITRYGDNLEITNGKLESGETPTPTPSGDLKTNFYKAVATTVEADKEYTLALYQDSKGKVLYFNGKKNVNFIDTTEKFAEAVKVKLVAVEGGYQISFVVDGKTQYIDVYEYTAGKVGVQFTETPTAVFSYNAELKTLVTTVAGAEYYLGTYKIDDTKDYNTISASKTSYISGSNASKVDVTQFPTRLLNLTEELNGSSSGSGSGTETPDPSAAAATLEFTSATTEIEGAFTADDTQQVWNHNGIKVTAEKNKSNTGTFKTPSVHARFYLGNSFKVEYTGMTKIVINCTYADKTGGLDGYAVAGATITVEGTVVTIVFATATDVFTIDSLPAQMRATSIEVYTK